MRKTQRNFAFIDNQNVHMEIRNMGWNLDYLKFRIYLREKYSVERAYIFIGYIEKYKKWYEKLESLGYHLIFKELAHYQNSPIKGNCDAELVLQAMIDYSSYDQAVIVTGDGDFACLAKYLLKQNKLKCILVPNNKRYSTLLNKAAQGAIETLSGQKENLHYMKRTPERTEP